MTHSVYSHSKNKVYAKIRRSYNNKGFFVVHYGVDMKSARIYIDEKEEKDGTVILEAYESVKSSQYNCIGYMEYNRKKPYEKMIAIKRYGKKIAVKDGHTLRLYHKELKDVLLTQEQTDHRKHHALIYAAYVHENIDYDAYSRSAKVWKSKVKEPEFEDSQMEYERE